MNVSEIQTLYTYNRWANHRVVDACRLLNDRDLTRDLEASYGSVRGTLVHILWGEWLWCERWRGKSPKLIFDQEQFQDVNAIESRWREVERDHQVFIDALTDELLADSISYENLQGERWEYSLANMMQHVANHSCYHRGQVVTLLRQLHQTPPGTDFLVFLDLHTG